MDMSKVWLADSFSKNEACGKLSTVVMLTAHPIVNIAGSGTLSMRQA